MGGRPLNEGRGVHPGDTALNPAFTRWLMGAQRRPGRSPRRHHRSGGGVVDPRLRSTKAGAFTPATRQAPGRVADVPRTLNEGRGVHPGDTISTSTVGNRSRAALNEGRGVHPGDTRSWSWCLTPSWLAQRRPGRSPRRHRRYTLVPRPADGATLNEGRGVHPGDTRPPARGASRSPSALNEGRGVHPGDTALAPGEDASLRVRSTKAGAFTPATRDRLLRAGRSPRPLNEGRGVHPGDTRGGCSLPEAPVGAQRRPGVHPGDTSSASGRSRCGLLRSTKAGAFTPATP